MSKNTKFNDNRPPFTMFLKQNFSIIFLLHYIISRHNSYNKPITHEIAPLSTQITVSLMGDDGKSITGSLARNYIINRKNSSIDEKHLQKVYFSRSVLSTRRLSQTESKDC